MAPEVVLFLVALSIGMAVLVTRSGPAGRLRNLMAGLVSLSCLLALSLHEKPVASQPVPGVPRHRSAEGYVGSDSCRACHPGEFSSWHDTYHRTMTQLPTPGNVVGDFEDVHLETRGLTYHLTHDEEGFWVEMVDPSYDFDTHIHKFERAPSEAPPRKRCRVVLATGSHNQQTYWVSTDGNRGLWIFPWYWIIEARRWAPREDVFLVPPEEGRMTAVWNHRCIRCHATGGRPGLEVRMSETDASQVSMKVDSTVVDLGIACEACHGPGEEHVAANRDPLKRYATHLKGGGDSTIVNPARLDPARSNEVCGQCHLFGQWKDREGYLKKKFGFDDFRPGDRLDRTRNITTFGPGTNPQGSRFWGDGTCRVGGREYNGTIESACFSEGGMTCLSCHSMHKSDPVDQLAEGMDSDGACLQCHGDMAADIEAHTHHKMSSSGSRCFNCHMPHSNYALLKAIRSHTIDSPTAEQSTRFGRPNACNLCHLDQGLAWTAEKLSEWYGQPPVVVGEGQEKLAAGPLWALEGDAVNRALVAWSMGWEPAQEASKGESWFAPYLLQLLSDPYSTVRYVAQRSLRRQPGFESLEYDYIAAPEARDGIRNIWVDRWKATLPLSRSPGRLLLFDKQGNFDWTAFLRHLARRDDSPVGIAE